MITPEQIKLIFHRTKQSAKKRNIPFTLTIAEFNELTFPITCPVFGMPLTMNKNQAQDNSYSIDRIESDKGYSIDNVIIVSWKANRLKNNITISDMNIITTFYQSYK